MRKALLIILMSTLYIIGMGQSFEGQIIYENTFKSKISNISDAQFSSLLGTRWEYYIKGGNYKEISNGRLQWEIYNHTENRIYTKCSNSDTVSWKDAANDQDFILSSKLYKNAAVIMGYPCDKLVLICKSGTEEYYFNTKLPVNARLYERHKYAHWYAYLSKTHAVPLKIILENNQYKIESSASSLTAMKLEDHFFALPEGSKTSQRAGSL
jgi:hypothetical protein